MEDKLKWCDLPHGTCFCSLRLKPDKDVRCSGEDISNYFYHLKLVESMRSRSAFGRVITGDEAVLLGGEHHGRYHLAMNAWCMGDHNAVDVAQEAHIRVIWRQVEPSSVRGSSPIATRFRVQNCCKESISMTRSLRQ